MSFPGPAASELRAWLRLLGTEGVGRATIRRLLAAAGGPEAVFHRSPETLGVPLSEAQSRNLAAEPAGLDAHLESLLAWLDVREPGGPERRVIPLGEATYPPALLETADPPILLYAMGAPGPMRSLSMLGAATGALPAIAIVGSRNPTAQGAENARQFARSLAGEGLCVVSGLALGVDGAAHQGALEAQTDHRLPTIAVVGTGLDRVYPKRHLALARAIAQRGLLLSEFPLGTPPDAPHFPQRNRIIAGLTLGTLVVEAAVESGSLITARLAAEQGREVFAIPGSIHSPQSKGCHALIRDGARLVEAAQDILDELKLDRRSPGPDPERPRDSGEDDPVLSALGHDPIGLDGLLARTGIETARLQALLLELELSGDVARLAGGRYQRITRA